MAKIQPDKTLVDLDGKPLQIEAGKNSEGLDITKDLTLGNAIALLVLSGKSADPLRAYVISQKMLKDEPVELDVTEVNFVKDSIKSSEGFTTIMIGQVLLALE